MSKNQTTYVIPDHLSSFSSGAPFLLFLLTVPLGAVVGAFRSGEWGSQAADGALAGLFGAIPLVIVIAVVRGLIVVRKMRKVWSTHSYQWYRDTFPAHAHERGRVSCRHCGGTRIQVRNLMNQTFTRAHACAQCGETLYFSAEKV